MEINVTVTQEDIDNGAMKSCNNCPVALALKRTLQTDVEVRDKIYILDDTEKLKKIKVPLEVSLFIENFDEGYEVKPLTFTLDV